MSRSRLRRHTHGRWRRRLLLLIVLLPALTILQVLVLRWLDPPSSMVMLLQRLESRNVAGFELDYRWRDWQALSPHLPIALVAAEDQQFPAHHGFDLDAIGRALDHNDDGGRVRGASTISQQVAKNLFLWQGRSWLRKGMEAWYTLWLETLWPKQRVLRFTPTLRSSATACMAPRRPHSVISGSRRARSTARKARDWRRCCQARNAGTPRAQGRTCWRGRHGWSARYANSVGRSICVSAAACQGNSLRWCR